MKKMLVVFTVLLFSLPVFAADHAIRIGCANNGDGTSWNCASSNGGTGAYNTIPSSLTRGDTYYFSAGTLTWTNFLYPLDDAESGTTRIWLKKATDATHGPSTGWSSNLGNGQTIFKSDSDYYAIFRTSYDGCGYYTFDGAYGSGSNPDDYGFKFAMGTTATNPDPMLVYGSSNSTHYEYFHIAFVGPYPDTSHCSMGIADTPANTLIRYCLFQGFDNAVHGVSNDVTVDNTWFTQIWGGGASSCHGQQISVNDNRLTVSNSVFLDSGLPGGRTAFISFNDARTPGFGSDGWKIYNNLFINPMTGAGGIITNSSSGGTGITNAEIYNNTCVGGDCKIHLELENPVSKNVIVKNNLYYNTNMAFDPYPSIIHDYNYWDSTCTNKPTKEVHGKTEAVGKTELFIAPENFNFKIKKADSVALNSGVIFSSPFNFDKNGIARPVDSPWDIGAYEHTNSVLGGPGKIWVVTNP